MILMLSSDIENIYEKSIDTYLIPSFFRDLSDDEADQEIKLRVKIANEPLNELADQMLR